VIPSAAKSGSKRRFFKRAWFLVLLLPVTIGGGYWWFHPGPALPPGFAYGNGRLEADEINIDTKFAGRIAGLSVDEGDIVAAGQAVAKMDTRDLEASLKKAQALLKQAQKTLDEAKANLAQQDAQVVFAKKELDRTSALVPKGYATVELLDQRRQLMNAAIAAQAAQGEDRLGKETSKATDRSR
jgi:HlyD family secretion protein